MKIYDWFILMGWLLIVGSAFAFNVLLGCVLLGLVFLLLGGAAAIQASKKPPEDK